MLDVNENNYIVKNLIHQFKSINQFFELIDCLESDPKLCVPMFPDYKFWSAFRNFMNRVFKFKTIAKSTTFEIIMFLIVLFNTGSYFFFSKLIVIIIILTFDEDEKLA
jgi:hypothetical protein